jgi:hypothetical protein
MTEAVIFACLKIVFLSFFILCAIAAPCCAVYIIWTVGRGLVKYLWEACHARKVAP